VRRSKLYEVQRGSKLYEVQRGSKLYEVQRGSKKETNEVFFYGRSKRLEKIELPAGVCEKLPQTCTIGIIPCIRLLVRAKSEHYMYYSLTSER